MTMRAYGPYDPPTIDPADYPAREMLIGSDPAASTVIMWFDRPIDGVDPDLLATLDATAAACGHVLMMARDTDTLARVAPLVRLAMTAPGGQA